MFPFSYHAPHSINWDQVHLLADKALYMSKDARRKTWTGIVSKAKSFPLARLIP
ncbi:hypothetical protein GPUN_0500 [Glaciecola punicea ACAM 611]|uniref:GGDEF domain-containing protein n=1 Tax=Glaciecola punicea ACAM 611 TaxID=1121923 RepID=H5T8K6_9ALTE|nr:hypothetical protein GPUN_0500 [Glaciecola punicea ACAM 611]